MIQAVLLFLVLIVLLGIGGKWLRLPPRTGVRRGERPAVEAATRCTVCAAYVVGKTPAPCGRDDCPYR
jgi:hypothetical protein